MKYRKYENLIPLFPLNPKTLLGTFTDVMWSEISKKVKDMNPLDAYGLVFRIDGDGNVMAVDPTSLYGDERAVKKSIERHKKKEYSRVWKAMDKYEKGR